MRILLINPPQILPQGSDGPYVFQPLGLAYIAAALGERHEVGIFDATAEGWERRRTVNGKNYLGVGFDTIKERIESFKPDIVGVTVPFTINVDSALFTASAAKSVDERIVTVLGGPHPTICPTETVSHPAVDFVVVGEGEHALPELVGRIEEKDRAGLGDVRGIAYKKDGRTIVTAPRPVIEDLDALPLPARHLLPMQKYFDAAAAGRCSRSQYDNGLPWASLITSRGCPYRCNFCSIKITMGNRFRSRSPENVIREIGQLVGGFGVRALLFEDDNISFDKGRLRSICDRIIENRWDVVWGTPNGIRADLIDEHLVMRMKESGCRRVFVAPESGVQRVLTEVIGKRMDLGKVTEAVRLFNQHGVTVDGSFVIGSIGETKREIWGTIRYALKLKRLGLNEAGFHIATPLYGTRLYEEAVQKGYLKGVVGPAQMFPHNPVIETPQWSGTDLVRLKKIANWLVNYTPGQKLASALRQTVSAVRRIGQEE